MTRDVVLEHWNKRATLAERAGSNDLIAKELEVRAISKHIKTGMVVAEFGCGNGTTAIELLRTHDIELHCYDFSAAMIESAKEMAKNAGVEDRIRFSVADIRESPALEQKFDVIYSERMIINLGDWPSQARAIQYLLDHLKSGGRYLMCENSKIGLNHLNALRSAAGLEEIVPPWHNLYLDDTAVAALETPGAYLVEVDSFSATYYFLSRVVNAWLAKKDGKEPSYAAPVNELALELPAFGDCSQGKLWIFERTKS